MAERKKAPTRKTKAPAGDTAPAKKSRTAKAASAKTAEVTSAPVMSAEALGAALATPAEAARPASAKAAEAAAVLMETVEAVKAAAVRATETPPAATAARAAETARGLAPAFPRPEEVVAPAARMLEAGTERAREAYARAQDTTNQLRRALAETTTASTRGALEVNGKVIDALRAQSDATIEAWRSTLTAGSFSEAVRAQTSGARQVYEAAATHWRDVAETTTRWIGETVRPIQSAWVQRGR